VIIFGSVRFLSKKVTKPKLFFLKKKPNRNRVKPTGFGSVRFFRAKTGSNRFGSVFSVWLDFFRFGSVLARFGSVFFGFGSVFPVWLGFGSVFPVQTLKFICRNFYINTSLCIHRFYPNLLPSR
jgi:hypothetical protein